MYCKQNVLNTYIIGFSEILRITHTETSFAYDKMPVVGWWGHVVSGTGEIMAANRRLDITSPVNLILTTSIDHLLSSKESKNLSALK